MDPTVIGLIVFACAFGGALFGMWFRAALPEHHLNADSRETVMVAIGLIATMAALVLGLITASTKSSFDAMDTTVKQTAIEVLSLDRLLARYGPETGEIRKSLKHAVGERIEMVWPQGPSKSADLDPMSSGVGSRVEKLTDAIRSLHPSDDSKREIQSRTLDFAEKLLQSRWLVFAGNETSVPVTFLVILLFWLTIIFICFGLFAPRNATVVIVLFVCAVSVSSAVFLVLELDTPFEGFLKVSAEPLRYAYANLNQ